MQKIANKEDLIVIKNGENLEIHYKDGSYIKLEGFYTLENVSLELPTDENESHLLSSNSNESLETNIVYAQGDMSKFSSLFVNNDFLLKALNDYNNSLSGMNAGDTVSEANSIWGIFSEVSTTTLVLGGVALTGGIVALASSGGSSNQESSDDGDDGDTTNPTVILIENDNEDGVVSDSDKVVEYTVTFSEAIKSLLETDLSITGGVLVADSIVLSDDKLSATFSVTADDDSTTDLIVNLNNTVKDLAGNSLIVPEANTLTVDTKNPTVTITDNTEQTLVGTNNSVIYTFTFSEVVTGFTADDITVENGVKGNFTASTVENEIGKVYTLEVTADNYSLDSIVVSLDADVVIDSAGNNNLSISDNSQTVNTFEFSLEDLSENDSYILPTLTVDNNEIYITSLFGDNEISMENVTAEGTILHINEGIFDNGDSLTIQSISDFTTIQNEDLNNDVILDVTNSSSWLTIIGRSEIWIDSTSTGLLDLDSNSVQTLYLAEGTETGMVTGFGTEDLIQLDSSWFSETTEDSIYFGDEIQASFDAGSNSTVLTYSATTILTLDGDLTSTLTNNNFTVI